MTGFFSIGMTKGEVMSKLGSTQATSKTKQFIQNFWNTDIDSKVTNEIELAMLESWASGSERVKMPTKGDKKKSPDTVFDNSTVHYYSSKSGAKHTFTFWDGTAKGDMDIATWNGNGQEDELLDLDGDGYADIRDFKTDDWDVNPSHTDKNMDGNLLERSSENKIIKKPILGEPKSYENIDITF